MPTMKTLTIGGTTYDLEGGVTSVNGQTGAVVLDASDVGAATPSDLYSFLPVDSASGAIASFPDGADSVPVEALSVAIEPVQDLHGQSSPYPAGGGKNKFGLEFIQNTTFTLVNGYYRSDVPMCKAGTYKWTGYTFTASVANLAVRLNDLTNPHFMVASGNIVPTANFVLTSDAYLEINYTPSGFLSAVSAFKGQLEEGSTATDWSPYSNICPITGWSEAKVWCEATHDTSADPTVTIDLSGTRYGGTLDVLTGVLTVTMANIASYAGETIGEPWLSSMDAYVPGATPTTGAQVVYTLSTPLTVQLTAEEVRTILGQNNIWANCGDVSVSYRADIQKYIDKKLS